MEKAELVFISTPAIGNLVPIVEFAQDLITYNPRLSATILNINFPQRPLISAYAHSRAAFATGIRFIQLPTVDPPAPDEFQSSIAFISLFIEKHKSHVKEAIANLASSENLPRIAGLFVDMFSTAMIDAANELGIPCYLFFASPASFLGFMLHLPRLDAQLRSDSDTEFTIPSFINAVPRVVSPSVVLKRKDGYCWLLRHSRRYRETKGIIVNTFRDLEAHAIDSLPLVSKMDQVPRVYPVGPGLDTIGPERWHPNGAQQESITRWLDRHPPSSVVFMCFGSMGSLGEAQIRQIAIGLEGAGYRFLWSIREKPKTKFDLPTDHTNLEKILPEGFVQRTAEMGLICGWVPQVRVLAHQAIGGFVSHCGWNSILESVWYGVPIATWPVYAEQQMNAFLMVKELGLAVEITLDYTEGGDLVLAEDLEIGIKRLMRGDDAVRRKVEAMKEKSRRAAMEGGSSHESLRLLAGELLNNI